MIKKSIFLICVLSTCCLTTSVNAKPQSKVRPKVVLPGANKPTALKPFSVFQDCAECPKMIVIPAGKFIAGDLPQDPPGPATAVKRPPHEVTIGYTFAIGKFEVTSEEWMECVKAMACPYAMDWIQRGDYFEVGTPISSITIDVARQYTAWLSKKTGRRYRLPSDMEWEYAARAGVRTVYPWGDAVGGNNANCRDCAPKDYVLKPDHPENFPPNYEKVVKNFLYPVGQFPPNAWGLHDVVGNAWEFTDDCSVYATYHELETKKDSTVKSCQNIIVRGGGYQSSARGVMLSSWSGAWNGGDQAVKRISVQLGLCVAADMTVRK